MTRDGRNPIGSGQRLLGHVAGDRKKTVLAVGLVVVMAIMWGRVLTGQKPRSTSAAPNQSAAAQGADTPAVKLRFVELPKIEGRNDVIRRNFFSADSLAGFRRDATSQSAGTDTEVRVASGEKTQEVVARAAQRLRLEAVLGSENPRAFINDRLVGVGDTLSVTDGAATYVFEVLRIQDDSVLVGCSERQVALKLAPLRDKTN
jgi:hypothetical protein